MLAIQVERTTGASKVQWPFVLPGHARAWVEDVGRADVSTVEVKERTVRERFVVAGPGPGEAQEHLLRRPRILVGEVATTSGLFDPRVAGVQIDPLADLLDRHDIVVRRHVEDRGSGPDVRRVAHREGNRPRRRRQPQAILDDDLPPVQRSLQSRSPGRGRMSVRGMAMGTGAGEWPPASSPSNHHAPAMPALPSP